MSALVFAVRQALLFINLWIAVPMYQSTLWQQNQPYSLENNKNQRRQAFLKQRKVEMPF